MSVSIQKVYDAGNMQHWKSFLWTSPNFIR